MTPDEMAGTGDTRGSRDMPHLMLEAVGPRGVRRIRSARLLVVGMGGLGCAASQYLVSTGVAAVTLCDFDTVSESNLSRQVLYTSRDRGLTEMAARI
jgi:adenylyltransferase/sulfurtransferase